MAFVDRLFGRGDANETPDADVACPHVVLTARWEAPEEMGGLERASGLCCEACVAGVSGEEGRRLLRQSSPVTRAGAGPARLFVGAARARR